MPCQTPKNGVMTRIKPARIKPAFLFCHAVMSVIAISLYLDQDKKRYVCMLAKTVPEYVKYCFFVVCVWRFTRKSHDNMTKQAFNRSGIA